MYLGWPRHRRSTRKYRPLRRDGKRTKPARAVRKPNSVPPSGCPREGDDHLSSHDDCSPRSSDLPGSLGRAALERFPIWSCSVRGLPCLGCHHPSGALLPHLFTLTSPLRRGGMFSVALSFPSPGLGVTQRTALGSSDFPPTRGRRSSGRLEQARPLYGSDAKPSVRSRLLPAIACY